MLTFPSKSAQSWKTSKKAIFWHCIVIIEWSGFFPENPAVSLSYPYGCLTSCKKEPKMSILAMLLSLTYSELDSAWYTWREALWGLKSNVTGTLEVKRSKKSKGRGRPEVEQVRRTLQFSTSVELYRQNVTSWLVWWLECKLWYFPSFDFSET